MSEDSIEFCGLEFEFNKLKLEFAAQICHRFGQSRWKKSRV